MAYSTISNMRKSNEKIQRRQRRKLRGRKHIFGTPTRPRLCLCKSNRYLYAQVIDDEKKHTLVSLSSAGKESAVFKQNVEGGFEFGKQLGLLLKRRKIANAVFDRNGNRYHGVVRAVAEGVRKSGIKI